MFRYTFYPLLVLILVLTVGRVDKSVEKNVYGFSLKNRTQNIVFDLKRPKLDIILSRMGTAKDASGKKDTAVHSINALDSTSDHISPHTWLFELL